MSATYALDQVPDQTGKNILITGATSDIGLATAKLLAVKGGHVIMACRDLEKAQPLADEISTEVTAAGGRASALLLDTMDLDAIDSFVEELEVDRLDSVVLNASIIGVGYRAILTRSAKYTQMESHMACNVVGHFYLVHMLMELLKASPEVRVVFVTSADVPYTNSISYDVFTGIAPEKYSQIRAYWESKLGVMWLAHELERRFNAADVEATAVAAHPGYVQCELVMKDDSWMVGMAIHATQGIIMPPAGGALVLAVAATLPKDLLPEKPFFAPSGPLGMTGLPSTDVAMSEHVRNDEQAKKLWDTCEELCGVQTAI